MLSTEKGREYETRVSVRQAVFEMVDGEAAGEDGYSDRGWNATDDDSTRSESF